MDALNYSNIFNEKPPTQVLQYRAVAVAGRFGGGKTAFLTFHGVNQEFTATEFFNHQWTYNKIYANYHLTNVPNFVYLDTRLEKNDLIETIEKRSLLLIDEADEYFSNRQSMSGEQIDRVKYFNQVRKRQCDVIINIPFLAWLDKRLKEIFTDFYRCAGRYGDWNKYSEYTMRPTPSGDFRFYPAGRARFIDLTGVYDYYDHEEYIQKTPKKQDIDAKTINKFIKQLRKMKEFIQDD